MKRPPFRSVLMAAVTALAVLTTLSGRASPIGGTSFGADRVPDAKAERGGIVVEMWLNPKRVAPGGRVFASVRVTNRGDRTVYREGNECGTGPAPITVEAPAGLPEGKHWSGLAARFKQQVLAEYGFGEESGTVAGHFTEGALFGMGSGCFLISQPRPFEPGKVRERDLAWNVMAPEGTTITSGAASVTATFEAWESDAATDPAQAFRVQASATIEITGNTASAPTIVDYVDAALEEPRFRAWLEQSPADTWLNTTVVLWPNDEGEYPADPLYDAATDGAVNIGLARFRDGLEDYGSVTIDLPTMKVLGVRFEP